MIVSRALLPGLMLFVGAAFAADWPQWRGPCGTGHAAPNEIRIERLPVEPKTLWKIKAGEGLASPIVANGRAFLFENQGGKETLRAVDVISARELWATPIDDVFKDSQGPSGPRCTPVVDGDRVYVQSCRGELQCLAVADGRKLWGVNFTKEFGATFIGEKGAAQGAARHGNNGAPVIDGERLFAQVGSTNGASVVCFDKKSGHVIWKSQNDVAGYAAPVIATIAGVKQLVSFTADGLIGLGSDRGELLWRVPVKTAFSRHATTPVVFEDIVVVSSHQVGLMGIRIARSGERLEATQAWISKPASMNFASPVAVGRQLYGLGPARNVVCVDIPTGKMLWSKDGFFTTSADKAHAAFLVIGRNILMLTDGGTLVLFAADAQEFRELGRAQVCGANWCNPAYVDGTLFLREGLRQNGQWMRMTLKRD
jgi:outer membrane protein assembly factor BamB